MAKGYWIVSITVHDAAAYDRYRDLNGVAFRKFGGRFLARGGAVVAAEGKARPRNVIVEFPTHRAALDCHASPEYQRASAERAGAVDIDLVIVEGYEGAQP